MHHISKRVRKRKKKVQMNLHPTDSGDRNTQDEAKHFQTVGFLFQICIQNGIQLFFFFFQPGVEIHTRCGYGIGNGR